MIRTLGKYISILYRQEQKYITKKLQQYDLGFSDFLLLLYTAKNEGCSQKKLCDILALDRALAARTMQKLEKEGYIERKSVQEDKRAYALHLTERGRNIIPILRSLADEWWETIVPQEQYEEAEKLQLLLEKMSQNAVSVSSGCAKKERKEENNAGKK